MKESVMQFWELASYIVTVIALPYAITLLMYEHYKEREVESEELYQKLAEEYAKFAQLLIENADLRLMTDPVPDADLTPEQKERKKVIFDVLVALFERAFILVYEEKMDRKTKRLWATWEDYILFWSRRPDFRAVLPELMVGEDPEFSKYIKGVADIN